MKNAIAILVLPLLILTGCDSKQNTKISATAPASPKNTSITSEGYLVKISTVSNSIEVPGNLMPFESTELHPEVSGRVVILNVKEGSNVPQGLLLVKLFDGDLQAQLKKLQVQSSISQKTLQRQGELLKISGISQQEYDLSGLEVNNLKADMDVIQTAIQKTEIHAPFNGRLGLRSISMGAYVTPQTVIATIQQVNKLKLEFTIPEKYTSNVSVGQPVNFTVEGNNKRYAASVIATESAVAENNRSLRIRAAVTVKDPKLVPGAFAKVLMDFGKDDKALLIPSQAIIPGARNKQVILFKNGVARFVVVGTGVRDSSQVQITSGLSAGDTVVTTGLLSIKPEGKLTISRVSNTSK